jgi:hypothetical protein
MLLAPAFYALGAALALGGGVLAMLVREASAAGLTLAIAGIVLVTTTTLLHTRSLMTSHKPEQE